MAFRLPTNIQLLAGYREVSASHRAALCCIEADASKTLAQTEVYYIKYTQASASYSENSFLLMSNKVFKGLITKNKPMKYRVVSTFHFKLEKTH